MTFKGRKDDICNLNKFLIGPSSQILFQARRLINLVTGDDLQPIDLRADAESDKKDESEVDFQTSPQQSEDHEIPSRR